MDIEVASTKPLMEQEQSKGDLKNHPAKIKKRTRAQRRREKVQKLKMELDKQAEGDDGVKKYDDRIVVKDNPNLVKYYKLQSFIGPNEFDQFMEGLRTTLPASFRINTFEYGQAKFLRQLVQGAEFKDYLTNANTDSDTKSPSVLEPLPWYPGKFAWQMNITRVDLKKSPILQSLHRFIMAETDIGFISRQESVSMIPPLVLDVHRGQNILDMCAAPGSKTAQLLEYLKFDIHKEQMSTCVKVESSSKSLFDDGLVVANDVDNKRCYMLVHQSNRLNSPNCVIINEDASRLPNMKTFDKDGDEYVDVKFDRILCDAPCSGDGTVRKNVDVWRKWSTGNANNFHGLQSKILKRGVELLKQDGLIVYSTCSMNPVEDEAVVASILRISQGSVVLEDCSSRLKGLHFRPGVNKWVVMNRDMEVVNDPHEVKPEQQSQIHASLFPPNEEEIGQFKLERCVRMLPHIQNTGAFFVACLRKLTPILPWEVTNADSARDSAAATDKSEAKKAPNPKKRRYGGFKEDPFVFIEFDDPDWIQIKNSYGLGDNFPANQLVHRCPSGKKRVIHLVSKATRNFMIANREEPDRVDFVKLINAGMRLFAKAESEAGFRICQDGVSEIIPYVRDDLKVPITKDDLKSLLGRQSVPMEEMSQGKHLKEKLKIGTCILIYKHTIEMNDGNDEKDISPASPIEVPIVAWRGERCVALYVSKTYRVHLRALIQSKIGNLAGDGDNDDNSIQTSETTKDNPNETTAAATTTARPDLQEQQFNSQEAEATIGHDDESHETNR